MIVHNNLLFSELHKCREDEESMMSMRQQRLLLNDNRAISSNTVITNTAAEVARLAGRKEDLVLETGEASIMVPGMDLEKIVLELLDNAFKYSKSGSRVTLSSCLADGVFSLSVKDSGRGMTAREIAEILKQNGVHYVQVWGLAHTT